DMVVEAKRLARAPRVQVAIRLGEERGKGRRARLAESPFLSQAALDRPNDCVGHPAELEDRLPQMPSGTEVDLRHRRKAGSLEDVDHHPGLHRVSGKEWDGQK